jgi:type II secretory ATPase GspE/PulE/Tfp pilus assembly ATPase PilB-like protein
MFTQHEIEHLGLVSPKTFALCASKEALARIPYEKAITFGVLPLYIGGRERDTLFCASSRELSTAELNNLRFIADIAVSSVVVPHKNFHESIFCAYHGSEDKLQALLPRPGIDRVREEKQGILWKPKNSLPASFLSELLEYALSIGASDVHLVPTRQGLIIRIRKDSALFNREEQLPSSFTFELVRRVRVLCNITPSDRDGSFVIPVAGITAAARASFLPTLHGEKVVLRLFLTNKQKSLAELGISAQVVAHIGEFFDRNEGALLVGGSTGSGKTTTLYSIARTLADRGLSVSSVEDPVESEIAGISQTCVGELSYGESLKTLLRQDPDVIMVGEIRDSESLGLFFKGASTGQLMISSLHGGGLSSMVQRLFDLGITKEELLQISPRLMHQQLLAKLCPACRVIHLKSGGYYSPGCSQCDYSGRQGALLITLCLELRAEVFKRNSNSICLKKARKIGALIGGDEVDYATLVKNGMVASI